MANRMKEDEKNEKIIRGLLKLPANRKCINCNSLGPQYVCTNFSIFICTNCSGIHREFTHRVKSVSMAKFTSQEVTNLQEGGNERAREIFFKEWDVQRNSFPDSSNIERLRTFIRHVYVDRRFTGEKPVDKPPRAKGDREDFEQRKLDMFRSGSRSPQYEDRFDRSGSGGRNDDRNFRYNYDEKRSPGYDQGDYRRSPRHFEIVDDRRRDDRPAIGNQNRRFEDRRFSDEVTKPDGSSPNNQKSADSSPVVRPVRDILGDNPPTLQVGEPPKPHVPRTIDGPPTTQLPHASSSTGQAVVNPSEQKSLIDFGADPGPSVAAMPEPSVAPQPNLPANDANWASFDSIVVPNAPQNSENVSSLESVLSQLSGPGSAFTTTVPLSSNVSTDSSAMPTAVQLPNMQHPEPSLFSQPQNQSTVQPFAPSLVGGSSDQIKIQSAAATIAVPPTAFTGQAPVAFVAPKMESNVPVSVLPNPEAKPSGRKELPANLFASAYPVTYPSMMGFYNRPNVGMALPMQYPSPVPTFAYSTQSANPFDVSSEPNLAHAATFPSLASLQGALPNPVNSSNIMRSASLGSTSFPLLVPQNQLHHPFAAVPGGYIGQQFQTFNPGQQFQGSNPGQQFHGNNPGQQFPISTPQQIPNTFHVGNHGIGNAPNQFATFGANAGFSQSGTSNVFRPAGSSNPFG